MDGGCKTHNKKRNQTLEGFPAERDNQTTSVGDNGGLLSAYSGRKQQDPTFERLMKITSRYRSKLSWFDYRPFSFVSCYPDTIQLAFIFLPVSNTTTAAHY